jgi:hypothetical protein
MLPIVTGICIASGLLDRNLATGGESIDGLMHRVLSYRRLFERLIVSEIEPTPTGSGFPDGVSPVGANDRLTPMRFGVPM